VSLPVIGQVVEATPEQPYLAIKMILRPQEITDLVLQMGQHDDVPLDESTCALLSCGLQVAHMDAGLLDSIGRLVALLDAPEDIAVLGPLVRREILYRVLMGELGPRMRKFALADHQASRVSKVIALLKDRFSEPLRVRDLADAVNMSESALFRSFKEVTRMSPVQFQKRLRLYEARRLMLAEGLEAATASFRVGYESPSHFSREYSRLFGASPRSDVVRQRSETRERVV
jgi:AraC-like DNA-binding protein